jgi:hypothetical protein
MEFNERRETMESKSFKERVEKMSPEEARSALYSLASQMDEGEQPTIFDLVGLFDEWED